MGLKPGSISPSIWQEKILERMQSCHFLTLEEYGKYLQSTSYEELALIERMVNSETWFFREKGAFNFLVHSIKEQNSNKPARILSVACSTGEEPYSIAIALLEAKIPIQQFQIDAMDISREAIAQAKRGVYRSNSFRNHDLWFRRRYFEETKEGYALDPKIKELVVFYQGDMLNPKLPFFLRPYSFIFCRNLLIYLNPEAQQKLLKRLKQLLLPESILIVGSAETMLLKGAGFVPVPFPYAHAFKIEKRETLKEEKILDSPKEEQFEPFLLSSDEGKKRILQEAIKLADAGSFESAYQLCMQSIKQHGATAEIYYLLGLISHAKGDDREAKAFFHKTIYLQPSHYEALICLSLLYESLGEESKARLLRKRAKKYG